MENQNKPVYPQIGSTSNNDNQLTEVFLDENNSGLTKLEYTSILMMQSIITAETTFGFPADSKAELAVEFAKALLRKLEQNEN